jgi:hypothetical protein
MKKITKKHIEDLLKLFSRGLISGAGQDPNHFCVQQAVHKVLDGELEAQKSDRPPQWCVKDEICSFGIRMNDAHGWGGVTNRAKGLRRFAVAELGSNKINYADFHRKLVDKLSGKITPLPNEHQSVTINRFMENRIDGMTPTERLTFLANAAADVLAELGTEGSQFLHLLDEPDKKKQKEETHKLGRKIFAAQLAEFGPSFCTTAGKSQAAQGCSGNK